MIERYTLPEMGKIWTIQNRFERLLDVEKAVARAQAQLKIIPEKAARVINGLNKINVERILEIEKTTKHDVIAFVTSMAEKAGPEGRYIHFGLTSSDVLDTAVSLQIEESKNVLLEKLDVLEEVLKSFIKKHKDTLCVGRTHGMHAEPTTLGLKFAGFLAELKRNKKRVSAACTQASVVKLSGAVGTYSSLGIEVEQLVAKKLKLPTEDVATQVIPRDRHAEVFSSLALLGAGFERLAIEVRHLQRTEVGELEEGFQKGQKGSSAMPHKRNPIASENITGLARLLRGYLVAAIENVALWHERDISHSSVERVIFPDAFILAHYATDRMIQVVKNLSVNKKRMKENLDLTHGQVFSSHILLELIKKGMSREDAYALVQRHSHQLTQGLDLETSLLKDAESKKLLSKKELARIFSGVTHRKSIHKVIERVLK
ncbi:MAG: adenylosuccinate lyase [Oligoflexia bacterium]|nr:adenylosuccinate lyase [Oligoflexia bacterium]